MTRRKQVEADSTAAATDTLSDSTLIDLVRTPGDNSAGQITGPAMIAVSIATDIGRVRRNNEDYVQAERVIHDNLRFSLWAVADGVGGGPQGELASRAAVESIIDYLTHEPWTDPATALSEAFAVANHNVYAITGEGAAASTMVAALVTEPDGLACIANVGDSRAYVVLDGEARQVTDDHSVVAARVAAGQITAEEARTAPDRNVLTRSVGSETEVKVDVFGPRQLQLNERLVLCTDGVHGMIDDATLGRLASDLPIADCAGALVAAAVEAGGRDNATALVGGYAPFADQTVSEPSSAEATESAESEVESAPSPPPRRHRRRWFFSAILGIGLAILVVLVVIARTVFSS